jgi:hypothetical protein
VHRAFNSVFYLAAATVIPVLYLALTIQGSLLPGLLTRLHRNLELMAKPKDEQARQRRVIVILGGAYALIAVAVLIIAAGVVGEIVALLALLRLRDATWERLVVLWSLVGLLVVTAAGPLWALNAAWVRLQWIPLRRLWKALRHGTNPLPMPAEAGGDLSVADGPISADALHPAEGAGPAVQGGVATGEVATGEVATGEVATQNGTAEPRLAGPDAAPS